MKLDKRFVLGAAFVLGLGMNLTACGGDDDDNGNSGEETQCNVTKESCEEKGQDFDEANCACKEKGGEETEDLCGNGKLDDGEVCDTVDGEVTFASDKGTCQLWYDENKDQLSSSLVTDDEAKPGCSKDCKAHSQGTCKTEETVLCGNGQIDEGETCDIGLDGQAKTSDDVIAEGITCNDYQEGSWKEGGKPSCAADCKGYGAGSGDTKCESADVADDINGIVSCKADITADNTKATGTAIVETADANAVVKGKIVCESADSNIGKAINLSKVEFAEAASGTITANEVTTAYESDGNYSCVFYVEITEGQGAVCSKDGTVSPASKSLSEYDGASFEVTGMSTPTDGAIAVWNTFADDVSVLLTEGLKVQDGSDTAALIKLTLGSAGYKKDGTTPAFKATVNSGKLRIQADAAKNWGDSGTINDTHSYLSIATTALAKDSQIIIKLDTRGATLQLNAGDTELKNDIKTEKGTSSEFTVDVAANTSDIRLYSLTADQTVIDIESIVIK